MMTFEEWREEQFARNPNLRRSSGPFLRQLYAAHTTRQLRGRSNGASRRPRVLPWRRLVLSLGVSVACTGALAALDEDMHSLQDLMRLENVPALVLYTLMFFAVTMLIIAAVTAPAEKAG